MAGKAGARFEAEISRVAAASGAVDEGAVEGVQVVAAGGLLVVAVVDLVSLVGGAVGCAARTRFYNLSI